MRLAGLATTLLAVNSVATSLSYYQESLMTLLPGHANLTVGLHRALTQNDLAPDSSLLPDAAPRSEERTQRERRLAALPWGTTLSHTFTTGADCAAQGCTPLSEAECKELGDEGVTYNGELYSWASQISTTSYQRDCYLKRGGIGNFNTNPKLYYNTNGGVDCNNDRHCVCFCPRHTQPHTVL